MRVYCARRAVVVVGWLIADKSVHVTITNREGKNKNKLGISKKWKVRLTAVIGYNSRNPSYPCSHCLMFLLITVVRGLRWIWRVVVVVVGVVMSMMLMVRVVIMRVRMVRLSHLSKQRSVSLVNHKSAMRCGFCNSFFGVPRVGERRNGRKLTLCRPRRSSSAGVLSDFRSSSYHALRLFPPNMRSSSSIIIGSIQRYPPCDACASWRWWWWWCATLAASGTK